MSAFDLAAVARMLLYVYIVVIEDCFYMYIHIVVIEECSYMYIYIVVIGDWWNLKKWCWWWRISSRRGWL